MSYHARVVGPGGRVYQCEHSHRTETAAITCANSSGTRQMAAMVWRRQALQEAKAAEQARLRAEARAAEAARREAARLSAEKARAAIEAAAERAKAEKRAAKLAAMRPERAWKKMTHEERLLKTAESELAVYGVIVTEAAKAAHIAKHGSDTLPAASAAPGMNDTETADVATVTVTVASASPPPVSARETPATTPAQRTEAASNGRHARPEDVAASKGVISEPAGSVRQIGQLIREAGQCFSAATERLKTARNNPQGIAAIYADLAGEIFTISGKTEVYLTRFAQNLQIARRRLHVISARPSTGSANADREFLREVIRLASAWPEAARAARDFSGRLSSLKGHSTIFDNALSRYQAQLRTFAELGTTIADLERIVDRVDVHGQAN
jgi:hypothetical protein